MSFNIPSFPDVPNVPGVPQVLRNPQAAIGSLVNSAENVALGAAQGLLGGLPSAIGQGIAAVNGAISNVQNLVSGGVSSLVNAGSGLLPTALTGDVPSLGGSSPAASNKWGIFNQDGSVAIAADSVKSFDFKHEWRLPNYPMEQGAFQNYDKVQLPYEPRITIVKSGKVAVLNAFLNSIETAANSVNLYNIFTTGQEYTNVSISSYNYKRSSENGVTMLTVEIAFEEIRLAAPAAFSSTTSPNGANPVNGGILQAIPITTAASLTNGLPTNNAQFLTGNAAPPSISSAASGLVTTATVSSGDMTLTNTSVNGSTVSSVLSTETPAVSSNQTPGAPSANASFPASGSGGYVDGNGNALTYEQGEAPGVATYKDLGNGNLIQTVHDSNGGIHFTQIPKPAAVQ